MISVKDGEASEPEVQVEWDNPNELDEPLKLHKEEYFVEEYHCDGKTFKNKIQLRLFSNPQQL